MDWMRSFALWKVAVVTLVQENGLGMGSGLWFHSPLDVEYQG